MTYSVELTEQAAEDLREIFDYISKTLLSPNSAEGQLERIQSGIMSLNDMPYRFPAYDREPWQSRGLRKMIIDSFLVFYIPDDEKRRVTVIRVMYGRRNIDREFM